MTTLRTLLLSLIVLALGFTARAAETVNPPRLILFITIDQLRGDMPLRYADRFGEGGFRRLLDQGLHYSNAHYTYAVTFTAVGHTTLATGGGPADHGVIGNDWADLTTGKQIYCVEDFRHTLIGRPPKEHEGSSPRNLTSSTFGDELILASAGKSRVFSVSGKDRGAILPAGHLGKAFWYDKDTGQYVTSTYYYPHYPAWVESWNQSRPAEPFRGQWELLKPRESYAAAKEDDRPSERPPTGLGLTFPHPLNGEKFLANLPTSPMADELTARFAKALIDAEQLGQRDATDLLAMSFSATDYIGHSYGPDSLEAEDNLLRLDRTLADLFTFTDNAIGPGRTLIVLSSDHGIDLAPESHQALGHDAGRHIGPQLASYANQKLRDRLKVDADLVNSFWQPSFYLNAAKIAELGLNLPTVEHELADIMSSTPGIALAATRTDLLAGRIPANHIAQALQRSFHPARSGHVLIIQAPHWYLYSKDTLAAMHGSPYRYDTYVPVFFQGPGIPARRITRPINPADIAPTLAQLLHTVPPTGSTGIPLSEVLAPH